MKPRGGLSLSTRGGFLWLQTQPGRPEPARGLFQQSLFALAESLQKRMHPLESGDTSFSVYSNGINPLGAYALSIT